VGGLRLRDSSRELPVLENSPVSPFSTSLVTSLVRSLLNALGDVLPSDRAVLACKEPRRLGMDPSPMFCPGSEPGDTGGSGEGDTRGRDDVTGLDSPSSGSPRNSSLFGGRGGGTPPGRMG
jgi:hypothetical protein